MNLTLQSDADNFLSVHLFFTSSFRFFKLIKHVKHFVTVLISKLLTLLSSLLSSWQNVVIVMAACLCEWPLPLSPHGTDTDRSHKGRAAAAWREPGSPGPPPTTADRSLAGKSPEAGSWSTPVHRHNDTPVRTAHITDIGLVWLALHALTRHSAPSRQRGKLLDVQVWHFWAGRLQGRESRLGGRYRPTTLSMLSESEDGDSSGSSMMVMTRQSEERWDASTPPADKHTTLYLCKH